MLILNAVLTPDGYTYPEVSQTSSLSGDVSTRDSYNWCILRAYGKLNVNPISCMLMGKQAGKISEMYQALPDFDAGYG